MTVQHPPIAQFVRRGLTRGQLEALGKHLFRCTRCLVAVLRATESQTARVARFYQKLAERIPAQEGAEFNRQVRTKLAPVLRDLAAAWRSRNKEAKL